MSSSREVYFITHPDVRVDPLQPVPNWSLSERGLLRMRAALSQPWVGTLTAVYSSAEQKAREGAQLLAERTGQSVQVRPELGEVDRSATGYLPHADHEAAANEMFAQPALSARGWETARHAQGRIVSAVQSLVAADATTSRGFWMALRRGRVDGVSVTLDVRCVRRVEGCHSQWLATARVLRDLRK